MRDTAIARAGRVEAAGRGLVRSGQPRPGSPVAALGLGDAENDFDLLDACGWSACPENALPQVKARVDWILPGADGEGVRRAIDEQILENNLPPPRTGRHQIYLG